MCAQPLIFPSSCELYSGNLEQACATSAGEQKLEGRGSRSIEGPRSDEGLENEPGAKVRNGVQATHALAARDPLGARGPAKANCQNRDFAPGPIAAKTVVPFIDTQVCSCQFSMHPPLTVFSCRL